MIRRTSLPVVALVALVALTFSGLARPASAQVVYGVAAVEYNPETTIVSGYSLTLLDYVACYYYDAYVEGYLYQDLTNVDADGERGVCAAEAFTDSFATGGHFYTQLSDHYIVAFYYYPGLGYYDPYGYGLFGGEYGGSYNFYGCFCPAYYFEQYIYLGSTAATIFLEPPCNKTPKLTGPSQVKRGTSAEVSLTDLCDGAQISDWTFTEGSTVVKRGTNKGSSKWRGTMVTSGKVAVIVKQGGKIHTPPPFEITVTARDELKFSAVEPSKVEPGTDCAENGKLEVLDTPQPMMRLGVSCVVQRASWPPVATIGDDGPNRGYKYLTNIRNREDGKPIPLTTFMYTLTKQLETTSSDFYRSQCGTFNRETNPGGIIAAPQLLSNTLGHEAGLVNSHYKNYKTAQDDAANNIGFGLEAMVGKPGETTASYETRLKDEANKRRDRILQAMLKEPCNTSNTNLDAKCDPHGLINYSPYLPCPPTLSLGAVSRTQVDLTWIDNSFNAQGFQIGRKGPGDPDFLEVGRKPAAETRFSDERVTAGTTYSYAVRAFNSAGFSPNSNVVPVTVPSATGTGPQGPTGLGSGTVASTQITITWTDNSSDETGFHVERKTGTGSFALVATVGANLTSYNDSTVSPATTYTYRVAAFNAAGDSPYSNEISATTPAGNPPNPPSGLTATASASTRIDLAWTDNSTNETGFAIERRTGIGAYAQIVTVGTNVTTYADSTVAASTTYTYRVKATGNSGDSASSNEATATTPAPPAGLAAPANFAAVALSSAQIQLSWTDTSSGEDGFKIERKTGAELFDQIGVVGANVTGYIDVAVTANTNYTYRVRAYQGAAHSDYSNEATATTMGVPLPAPAGNLTATLGAPTRVDLTWTDQSWNELGFRVERKTGSGAFALLATIFPNVTAYSDSSVSPFTTYTYRVIAFGEGGDSLSSNWATVTTPSAEGAGPLAPCCLQAYTFTDNGGGAVVSLTWADRSSDETSFRLERRLAGELAWTTFATLPADSTSFSDITASLGWTYQYRVGAANQLGISYSGVVEVTAGQ